MRESEYLYGCRVWPVPERKEGSESDGDDFWEEREVGSESDGDGFWEESVPDSDSGYLETVLEVDSTNNSVTRISARPTSPSSSSLPRVSRASEYAAQARTAQAASEHTRSDSPSSSPQALQEFKAQKSSYDLALARRESMPKFAEEALSRFKEAIAKHQHKDGAARDSEHADDVGDN